MAKRNKPDYADIRQLTQMVEETYRGHEKVVRRATEKAGRTKDDLDYGTLHVKRRVAATVSATPQAMARVKGIYPNIPGGMFSLEETWARINASTFFAYDKMEEEDTLTLAVAMWMLDHIKASSKLQDAVRLLPRDEDVLDDVYLPDVWDACHSDELLRGMVYAIQHRNADCAALPRWHQKQAGDQERRFFMDDYTAAGIHRQQVPSRQRFEALTQLIPQSAMDQAAQRCEEKMWEWAVRYFSCLAIFAKEEQRLHIKMERLHQEAEAKAKEQQARQEALQAAMEGKGPVMSPLRIQPPTELLRPMNEPFPSEMADALGFMVYFQAEEERLENAKDALFEKVVDFQLAVQHVNTSFRREDMNAFGQETASIMAGFSVDDPYEPCFGMLYLIDQGSDLPWLYAMGLSVLHQASIRLPWYPIEYDEEDDPLWTDADSYTGERRPTVEALPSGIPAPEMPDWYRLDYLDQSQDPLFQAPMNLAQIFYELTGAVMPRNPQRYYPALRELSYYGIKGKKATLPLLYCMTLAGEAKRRDCDIRQLLRDTEVYGEAEASAAAEAEPLSAPDPQLPADITALKEENKRLRLALHHANREFRAHREQDEARARTAENQRQELADLRTLVFHREEGAREDDTPSDPSIAFPYETKRRTLVFGGHDSWRKEIKPRLPDARFIGKEMVPDTNLLRNAEIIWIQTNCLSHKQYEIIMRVARGRDIPVHYFAYASAVKCAEQVVREER